MALSFERMKNAKKRRLSAYLDPDVMRVLADYAGRREVSLSLVAEAALASFLSPDAEERKQAAITRRLDQIDRRVQRVERDVGIAIETLALFVRFWLNSTPALPESAQAEARAKGLQRYDNFVDALGRRLSKGPRLRQEIADDVPPAPPATG
ncbi:CopG family transcriptional regulator [Mesorhizobium sp. M0118]|uniref:CopG family transcriptional regulator n=2 Tax=Mesorhizobium TaxID=68287 RepID=UPI00333C452A